MILFIAICVVGILTSMVTCTIIIVDAIKTAAKDIITAVTTHEPPVTYWDGPEQDPFVPSLPTSKKDAKEREQGKMDPIRIT